jgi:protein required for attachment to host cells
VKSIWVIAADATRARIFEANADRPGLREIETLVHPEGRAQNRELKTDGAGRLFSKSGAQAHMNRSGAQAHAADAKVDPAQHEMDLFTKIITEYLDKARGQNRYDALYIVAPPKLLGLIRKHLSKPALKLVSDTFPKDISWFSERDVERYLQEHGVA